MHATAKYDRTGFRLRGTEMNRLEAFSDVVFGFAITLLVVSLEVPHTFDELARDLRGFLPFAVCFALLVQVWYIHYRFFRRYGMEDALTVTLNAVLLFVILFYVYPLKFLFTLVLNGHEMAERFGPNIIRNADVPTLMIIYAAGFATVFLIFLVLHLHAFHRRDELQLTALERHDTITAVWENASMVFVGVTSGALAALLPPEKQAIPGMWYSVIPVFMTVIGNVRGKARKKYTNANTSVATVAD
jgi:uncharacterized membrane protein